MTITKGPYQTTYEGLFDEARELFHRLRTDGPEMYGEHLRLSESLLDSFDRHGEGLLDSLFAEIHAEILSFSRKDERTNTARGIYEQLVKGGFISGARYQQLDRDGRMVFKYYQGEEDTKLNMKEVLDWLYHYSTIVAGWWVAPMRDKTNEGRFSEHYQPKTRRDAILAKNIIKKKNGDDVKEWRYFLDETPEQVLVELRKHLTVGYKTTKGKKKRYHLRSAVEWQAICLIIYNSIFFKRTRRIPNTKKQFHLNDQNKQWSFKEWSEEFCNLMEIPPFSQRPGNNEVKEMVEILLAGEFRFMVQRS